VEELLVAFIQSCFFFKKKLFGRGESNAKQRQKEKSVMKTEHNRHRFNQTRVETSVRITADLGSDVERAGLLRPDGAVLIRAAVFAAHRLVCVQTGRVLPVIYRDQFDLLDERR
jgi:hypothetical protein